MLVLCQGYNNVPCVQSGLLKVVDMRVRADYSSLIATQLESNMIRVTFYYFSKLLNKEFINVETHRSMDDARLRACALNWTIQSVEAI